MTAMPQPVRQGFVPRWLLSSLFRELGEPEPDAWFKTWGTVRVDGVSAFVCEPRLPYPPPPKVLQSADAIARRINCRLLVLPESARGKGYVRLLFIPNWLSPAGPTVSRQPRAESWDDALQRMADEFNSEVDE